MLYWNLLRMLERNKYSAHHRNGPLLLSTEQLCCCGLWFTCSRVRWLHINLHSCFRKLNCWMSLLPWTSLWHCLRNKSLTFNHIDLPLRWDHFICFERFYILMLPKCHFQIVPVQNAARNTHKRTDINTLTKLSLRPCWQLSLCISGGQMKAMWLVNLDKNRPAQKHAVLRDNHHVSQCHVTPRLVSTQTAIWAWTGFPNCESYLFFYANLLPVCILLYMCVLSVLCVCV